jgi:hypothetical protein
LYRAVLHNAGGSGAVVESFSFYNQYGEVLYTIREPRIHGLFLSDTGTVFAVTDNHLFFIETSGQLMPLKRLQCPNGFHFSQDHSAFFASDKDGVYAYSLDGELKHTFDPGRIVAGINQAQVAAIVSTDTLYTYIEGNLLHRVILSTHYTRAITITSDLHVVIYTPAGIERYDVYTGTKVEEK